MKSIIPAIFLVLFFSTVALAAESDKSASITSRHGQSVTARERLDKKDAQADSLDIAEKKSYSRAQMKLDAKQDSNIEQQSENRYPARTGRAVMSRTTVSR